MKFAICNEIYGTESLESVCEDAAAAGYVGLEIAPFTLADYKIDLHDENSAKAFGNTLRSFGLEPIGLHWLLAKTEGFHLTRPDDEVNQRTADYLIELARFCAAMGGQVMVFGSPQQRNLRAGESRTEALSRAAALCRQVCQVAGPLGLTLALEPLGEIETNFLNTAAETIEFIQQVDHPACSLLLDVKAMSAEVLSIPEIIEASKEHLTHFHANDPNLRGPGQGEVNFRPIAQKLTEINYTGYVSVEVFDFTPDPTTIARQSLDYMKSIWAAATIT